MLHSTEYRERAAEYIRQADVALDIGMAKAWLQLADYEEWLRMGYKYSSTILGSAHSHR
jgi:hypothetical protein